MKISLPPVKQKIAVVDSALAEGKYQICPEPSASDPDVVEPVHNPDRAQNVVRWVPDRFSFELPDGGAYFCDRLQNGDPSAPWGDSISSKIDFVDGQEHYEDED